MQQHLLFLQSQNQSCQDIIQKVHSTQAQLSEQLHPFLKRKYFKVERPPPTIQD